MGAKFGFERMSNAQLQQHIRLIAQDSHRAFIGLARKTSPFRARM